MLDVSAASPPRKFFDRSGSIQKLRLPRLSSRSDHDAESERANGGAALSDEFIPKIRSRET
jgi:hypothetical protein